ncbi:unnamed protein product [Caenorhabditis sp. 36 PRJEB53466]|nr:unnamed protein product [Caenorhabditis sp. 36 PRJEB53466]
MFSRVGRLTTFGAQAVSNCPFRRDNIYQQPLKVTAPINDQLVNFAHNFSDSLRPRTTSFGNDPFLGVPMDDEEVIKELELLDLDSWHTKPRPPCPAPSEDLELDQFWEGKNITLEAWRPTDSWNAPGPQQGAAAAAAHSSGTEAMHDFSNFGDNMGSPLFQSPSKSSVDQFCSSSSASNRLDESLFGGPSRQETKPKFEMDVENASKAVDWEAWNHYLESDDDIGGFKRPEAFFTSTDDSTSSHSLTTLNSSPDNLIDMMPATVPFQHLNLNPISHPSSTSLFKISSSASRIHHDVDLFSSGPLICVPKEEIFDDFVDNKDDDEYFPASESRRVSARLRKSTVRRREESERSWTPASDDYYPEEKSKFKKRGVVMKPSVDEETDRRRALNRVAAVRYREKKRAEKMCRKREYQEVADRNRVLVQKERQLKREINAMKKELRKMGAIIH